MTLVFFHPLSIVFSMCAQCVVWCAGTVSRAILPSIRLLQEKPVASLAYPDQGYECANAWILTSLYLV